MKLGIVFAGQGAQYEGMGKDLYDNYPVAKKIFERAGKQIEKWCFDSSKEVLRETHVTQPCVYTVTMAAYEVFMDLVKKDEILKDRVEVAAFAGFSLGEYAALTAAGAIDSIDHCNTIVSKRGELMHEAGLDKRGEPKGGMVAAFGDRDKIIEAIEEAKKDRILQGANFNSPIQTVVAGEHAALDDFTAIAKEKGIKVRALSVGTAFHSEMMNEASDKLLPVLLSADMKKPEKLCYSNITAKDIMEEYVEGENVASYLANIMAKQMKASVYWQEIIEDMIGNGVDVIIEIGPGKTLSSICKKVSHDIVTLNVEDCHSAVHTIEELRRILC